MVNSSSCATGQFMLKFLKIKKNLGAILAPMKRLLILVLTFSCFYISGCSLPTQATCRQIYSFTKVEKEIKGTLSKKKEIQIKDFRENQMYEEDLAALKQDIEKYISDHVNLSEATKSNLRGLKVAEGAAKEEIGLLLGKPDKILKAVTSGRYNACEIWIYRINKLRAFNVFILPIFFVHEGYYLYFKDDILVGIERHSLQQIVQQSPGPGIFGRTEKASN